MYSPFASQSAEPLQGAARWLTATLLGEMAVGLCVIAVAIIGLLMLSGRLPVRRGAAVVLGCFVLLGAPVIAGGFMGMGEETAGQTGFARSDDQALPLRQELPPSTYDPYAGASMRDDR